jgi:hypothetical protein
MLCFFERRDFRSIGQALGSSEDAARMRVKRALDKLHTLLTHRGVTLSAAALGTALATEAVTAAPAGLAASVAATALASAAASGATLTATKAIAVTTLRKVLLGTTLVAIIGTGIYQTAKASYARSALERARQQQAPLVGQVEQLTRERDVLATSLASARQDNERLSRSSAELLRLRGELARLQTSAASGSDAASGSHSTKLPEWLEMHQRAKKNLLDASKLLMIKQRLHLSPEQEAKIEENFNRRKQERDGTNYPRYEAELNALLTPEQQEQYNQLRQERSPLRQERSRPSDGYTAISDTAFEVTLLGGVLGLSQEQQDQSFNALVECRQAYQQSLATQQADARAKDLPVKPSSEESLLRGKVEALKGVLTPEQFPIYQTYIDRLLKSEKAHAAGL